MWLNHEQPTGAAAGDGATPATLFSMHSRTDLNRTSLRKHGQPGAQAPTFKLKGLKSTGRSAFKMKVGGT